LLLFAGCTGTHSALDPASTQARQISGLWWLYFDVTAVVFVLVIAFLLVALWRGRGTSGAADLPAPNITITEMSEPRVWGWVNACIAATVLVLFGLLLADFFTGRSLAPSHAPDTLAIKVTGHQWWWEFEYQDPIPGNIIQTANELHVPAGRTVQLLLNSNDVIHSFWVPSLQGKKDLVPGHPTSLWLNLDRPGVYDGQCAEFCGLQHAQMNLRLVVETPAQFAAWQQAQRSLPPTPANDRQRRGQQVFLTRSCVLCHTIAGTLAGSRVGPALSHLASQPMIGANAFPNTREMLRRWIHNAPAMKPGVRMPQNELTPEDMDALLDYLATLK
jgi:cytochrome c oxidase subunit 2